MGFFHSSIVNKLQIVSVSVWVLWAAYTFVCSIHAFKNREPESAIFYIRTFPKVIKANKYGPFSHD